MPISSTMASHVVLLDLDGVLRRWDPDIIRTAEQRHGLPPGSLTAVAFGDTALLQEAITGRLDDAEWRAEIVSRLAGVHGHAAELVVQDWSEPTGEVVPEVLQIVRELRATGTKVGLLTNATTRLTEDLRRLDLDGELDVIVGTAGLGVAKPDHRAFRTACHELGARPEDCVFVDDTPRNVRAAAALRMRAHQFVDAPRLRGYLNRLGLL